MMRFPLVEISIVISHWRGFPLVRFPLVKVSKAVSHR